MRLVTFNNSGEHRFGALLAANNIIDLYAACDELAPHRSHAFPKTTLEFLAGGDAAFALVREVLELAETEDGADTLHQAGAIHDADAIDFLPPITQPEKIVCIGQNYREHIKEMKHTAPEYPLFFAKYANTLTGHRQPIRVPRVSNKIDYEAELAVVIGRTGKDIPLDKAFDYVAGYMNFNDVSVRDYQRRTTQFLQGKTFDTSAPCGVALVTKDEIPDPHNLSIKLRLNGETMQDGTTADFIFGIPVIINYLSEIMTLKPGDIIATGTPSGVGAARDPQVFLKSGDTVEVEIEHLGTLSNHVVAHDAP